VLRGVYRSDSTIVFKFGCDVPPESAAMAASAMSTPCSADLAIAPA
jgi:hypothetical protein